MNLGISRWFERIYKACLVFDQTHLQVRSCYRMLLSTCALMRLSSSHFGCMLVLCGSCKLCGLLLTPYVYVRSGYCLESEAMEAPHIQGSQHGVRLAAS